MDESTALRNERRVSRLFGELRHAVERTDAEVISAWGKRAAARLVFLTARRVGGLASLIAGLARFGGREFLDQLKAISIGKGSQHLGRRSAAAIDGGISVGRESLRIVQEMGGELLRDPKRAAPKLLGTLIGVGAGSGGIDGNGGVPDLDLLAGIGYHRSPLTHTIIAGIVLEGLLLAVVDLASEVHSRLPHDHDPLWDDLAKIGRPFAESASVGISAGIAYHLMVDAVFQPGAYHGMPFEMPSEAHQMVFGANAAAEGTDAARRSARARNRGMGVLLEGKVEIAGETDNPAGTKEPSAGERFVAAIADGASRAGYAAENAFRRLAKSAWK
jgi:hypothetical protein